MRWIWENRSFCFISILFFLFIIVCVYIPPLISQIENTKLIGNVQTIEGESPLPAIKKEMQVIEKLQLLSEANNTNGIAIARGKHLDEESVMLVLLEEWHKLYVLGLVPVQIGEYNRLQVSPYFWIDVENPEKNIILWSVYLFSEGYVFNIFLDDETGLIYRYALTNRVEDNTLSFADYEAFGRGWAEYYDIQFIGIVEAENDYSRKITQYSESLYIPHADTYEYKIVYDAGILFEQNDLSVVVPIQLKANDIRFGL